MRTANNLTVLVECSTKQKSCAGKMIVLLFAIRNTGITYNSKQFIKGYNDLFFTAQKRHCCWIEGAMGNLSQVVVMDLKCIQKGNVFL